MANVKLTHSKTDRVIEVPEESAGPYVELGWEKSKAPARSSKDKPAESKSEK